MQKSVSLAKNSSLRITTQQSLRRLGLCSPTTTGQQTSPVIFPEKRSSSRGKASTRGDTGVNNVDPKKARREEHGIDIGDEKSDLLGYDVFSGKLSVDKQKYSKISEEQASQNTNVDPVDAKLTSKALIWGSEILHLDDVISVNLFRFDCLGLPYCASFFRLFIHLFDSQLSYCAGLRYLTVHAYPLRKGSCFRFTKSGRNQKDFRFFASSPEDALQWVNAFADQQCYINSLPHPMASKKQSPGLTFNDFAPEMYIRCKTPPKMLVILNPRSGRGRSSKVFGDIVEPIFKVS